MAVVVWRAKTSEDFNKAVALFKAYEGWASACPCFDGFERELSEVSDRYALSHGRLWLAGEDREEPFGVVGVKFLGKDTLELKRLWVEPQGRGKRVGESLIKKAVEFARSQGSSSLVLETVPGQMDSAIALYKRHGFTITNSLPERGTVEMVCKL